MNTKDTPIDYKQFEGHTPGPWESDDSDYRQYVFGPDREMICEMRGWGYLTGNRRKLSEAEAMAIQDKNCLLTAAAPDLLKENQSLKLQLQKQKEEIQRFELERTEMYHKYEKQKELNAESVKTAIDEFIKLDYRSYTLAEIKLVLYSLIKKSNEI